MEVIVRHAEPEDYKALHEIFSGPKAIAGTLQLPLPSKEGWRKKFADPSDSLISLVACTDGGVVGSISLATFPTRPRMRHIGDIGMAVRDDWPGKGVGSKLMEAVLDVDEEGLLPPAPSSDEVGVEGPRKPHRLAFDPRVGRAA